MKKLAVIAVATAATLAAASAAHAGWYDYWGNYHCVWGWLGGVYSCW